MTKWVAILCSLGFLCSHSPDVLNAILSSSPSNEIPEHLDEIWIDPALTSSPDDDVPVEYQLTAARRKSKECENNSLFQKIRASSLSSKEKFALLAERTDRLAQTVDGLCCKNASINPKLHDQLQNPCGGTFITADFLYWQADEDKLAYAIYDEGFNPNGVFSTSHITDAIRGLSFEWNPGFRVGVGRTFSSSDHWGLLFSFTHIRNKAHGSTNIGPLEAQLDRYLVATWDQLLLGSFATAARAHWSVNYNTEILDAYRDFFLGKRLIVRPRMGLLNANINQTYHASYTLEPGTPIFSTVPEANLHAKCNYWGLGVRGGADLLWHFSKHFGLYAELSAGLVYGRFHVNQHGNSDSLISEIPFAPASHPFTFEFKKKIWRVRATIQTALGLEWETIFNKDRNRIAISLGYEFNEWFRQNQFVESDHISGGDVALVRYNFSNADLAFKGGTLRAIFNF